jgi:hypothetical protein
MQSLSFPQAIMAMETTQYPLTQLRISSTGNDMHQSDIMIEFSFLRSLSFLRANLRHMDRLALLRAFFDGFSKPAFKLHLIENAFALQFFLHTLRRLGLHCFHEH